jgi:hypothetical protein
MSAQNSKVKSISLKGPKYQYFTGNATEWPDGLIDVVVEY